MNYDYSERKIVAVLSSNLEIGVALNVIGHMAISIGAYSDPNIMGRRNLTDKSGINHAGISKYPFIITKVKQGRLKRLVDDARQVKELLLIDYPKQMLHTGHDDELAEEISKVDNDIIEYLGAAIYGNATLVTSLTGSFTLWK
jgi:hypothetical protein